ncbi:MAG: adenine phosphoribosyltransferase [Micromonosporaceae bacterium]|nr:adenine phosphoribosyltransferase [Micromonosporaceae bacterium]
MGGATGDGGAVIAELVAGHVLDVPDFPQPGVMFKDLTPLFADGEAFRSVVDSIVDHHGPDGFDTVVGIEARGFVLAAAVAYATGVGVVPVRKAGKLPRETVEASYRLEYGEATLQLHADAFTAGERVLVLDDVLATGGTAEATLRLVEEAGGVVAGLSVVIELSFLKGREKLTDRSVHALLTL